MAAYAYPIKINRRKERIDYSEEKIIESDEITLDDLSFVGKNSFSVYPNEADSGIGTFSRGYRIVVHKSRMETDVERDKRVSKEESYMAEFNRRKNNKSEE